MTEELPIEIDVESVQRLIAENAEVHLLDCREPMEYEIARIEPSQLVPMNEIPSRISDLKANRQERLVVYCHHGMRSLQVTRYLRDQGFSRVQSLAGGIDAWSARIDPDVPRY